MVKYIKYNGKEYPIKLGQYSLRRFQDEQNAQLSDLQDNSKLYEPLLYFCLQNGARYEKKELDLTLDDMVDVLDECFLEFATAIPSFFENDLPKEVLAEVEKMEAGGGKKKSTSTGSRGKQ